MSTNDPRSSLTPRRFAGLRVIVLGMFLAMVMPPAVAADRPGKSAPAALVVDGTATVIGSGTAVMIGSRAAAVENRNDTAAMIGNGAAAVIGKGTAAVSGSAAAVVGIGTVVAAFAAPEAAAAVAVEPADDTDLAEADAAFDRGDHERALSLYLSRLRTRPEDLHALRRAGLLLGWAGRAGEAVPILERAVRLDPRDRATRLQLARVRSWNKAYEPSLTLYDALVDEDPEDTATAIERARVIGWSGRLADSEAAYRDILRRDPSSTEASLGLAQCLGWQGRLDESESLYRGNLEKDPSPARLGLGRLSLWRGDVGAALRAARDELATDPKNKDALDLEKAALDRMRPSIAFSSEVTDDTDDNRAVSASAGVSFHPGGAVDIDVTATVQRERGADAEQDRLEGLRLQDRNGDGVLDPLRATARRHSLSSESLGATLGFQAGARGRVSVGGAVERLGSYDRPPELEDRRSETAVSGFAAYRLILSPLTLRLSVAREVPKWTAFVTDRNLRWDHGVAGVEGRLPWKIFWAASGDAGRITGGAADNDRRSATARAWRRFDLGGPVLTARYAFRYLSYELNLNDGYFDPQHYASNIAGLDLGGRFAGGRWEWTIGADAGIERFRHEEEDESVCEALGDAVARTACRTRVQGRSATGNNTVLGYSARLSWNVRDRVSIEAYASRTESAAQTAAGFTSRAFGIAARIGL